MNRSALSVKLAPFLTEEERRAIYDLTPERLALFNWSLLGKDLDGNPIAPGWYELPEGFDNEPHRDRRCNGKWDAKSFPAGQRFFIYGWYVSTHRGEYLRVEVCFRDTTAASRAVVLSEDADRRVDQIKAMFAQSRRVAGTALGIEQILDYDGQAQSVLEKLLAKGTLTLKDIALAQLDCAKEDWL